MSIRLLFGFSLLVLQANPFFAQTASEQTPTSVLTINARTVVEDVVVRDKDGRAVPGLRIEDFQVIEDGKPQTVTFFEANFAASQTASQPSTPVPNTFTNIPAADPHSVTNVLLLDALDSWPEDEMYAHVQMVKYLASLPPGLRIGIFTLTPQGLDLIWSLNQDSSALRAAISKFASSHSATGSTTAQQQAMLSTLNQASQNAQDSRVADSAHALQRFLKYGPGVIQQHNHGVMPALQALAHYLAGIPGRKNLFWIIGNFPHCEPINVCSETIDMLGEAGISVYPIDAHGVDVNMGVGPDPAFHQAATRFLDSEYWAEDTGGKAYHVNDLNNEIADAVDHGSRYYTLAYVPSNRKEEGRERKIEVRVLSGKYTIFYRKHYFEQTPKEIKIAGTAPPGSPLVPFMGHGLPNSNDIPYRLKVVPSAPPSQPGAPRAGQNTELAGKLTRYDVGFQLQTTGLPLPPDANGLRRKSLQIALVVYSNDFKPLNWEISDIHLSITPEQWTIDQRDGIEFHLEIDAPSGDVSLRTGVYDNSSSKVGTLEIPLGAVTRE